MGENNTLPIFLLIAEGKKAKRSFLVRSEKVKRNSLLFSSLPKVKISKRKICLAFERADFIMKSMNYEAMPMGVPLPEEHTLPLRISRSEKRAEHDDSVVWDATVKDYEGNREENRLKAG